jgi:hypothetical protein
MSTFYIPEHKKGLHFFPRIQTESIGVFPDAKPGVDGPNFNIPSWIPFFNYFRRFKAHVFSESTDVKLDAIKLFKKTVAFINTLYKYELVFHKPSDDPLMMNTIVYHTQKSKWN